MSGVDDALAKADDTAFAIDMSNLVFGRLGAAGFAALPESARELWSQLTEAFYECRDNLTALERGYVQAHRADFR